MAIYKDYIKLIDRNNSTPTAPSNFLQSAYPEMEYDGDLTSWRIRLEMTNTGETGKVNSGVLTLRIDEDKTFINSGPILVDENGKRDYLIEAYIEQRDPTDPTNTNLITSKKFRFQLGSPSIEVQEGYGAILSITLQEIQYRMKESHTSRELRFLSPYDAVFQRVNDFNNYQGGSASGGVEILFSPSDNNLPKSDTLQLSYIPQSPQEIQKLIDDVFNGLSESQASGGVFKDYYYDFEPSAISTLTTTMISDEIGRVDSGVVLNPLSLDAIDSSQEQTAVNDFVRFKNHVIARGAPQGGSLPTEQSIWASKWEHAKVSSEWSSSNSVTDVDSNTYQYFFGQRVKITYNVTINSKSKKITRFFEAKQNVPTGTGSPATNTTYWKEWFIIYPEFDPRGRYFEDDIVYFNTGSAYRFYYANQDILYYTLGRIRAGHIDYNSQQQIGDLILPNVFAGWTSLSGTVPDHALSDFEGWFSYSIWTDSVYDWEKNQCGLASGSLPNNKYTGLVPDWNIAKDNYGKQDHTDEFENISTKWIDLKENDSANIPLSNKYHGYRVLIHGTGQNDFAGHNNKIAQWDQTKSGSNKWRFSREPVTNDIVNDLESGKSLYYDGSAWRVAWQVYKPSSGFGSTAESANNKDGAPVSPSPFHLVTDIYKTRGSDGTPSNAIEFRYAWDDEANTSPERRNSRGCWLWFWNPFPRYSWTESPESRDTGDLFGYRGNTSSTRTNFTTLNIYNNTSDRFQNLFGWNNGLNTEDMGKISALRFNLKVGFFGDTVLSTNGSNHTELTDTVEGFASIPMVFWAIDMFDRVWFHEFELRRNNQWQSVTIPFGDLSPSKRYFARYDELPNLWGIPITQLDFGLLEKEFTGVQFDWRFVRGWGMFYKGSYADRGHYDGGIDSWWDEFNQTAQQAGAVFVNMALTIDDALGTNVLDQFFADRKSEQLNYMIRQSTIAIDNLHYIKELVANSDDTRVSNVRTSIAIVNNEEDYENLKVIARARRTRLTFLPQYWHMRSIGDVRMRVGQKFTVTGDRVPNGTITDLACGEVKHIIDSRGYTMEVTSRRRFLTIGV